MPFIGTDAKYVWKENFRGSFQESEGYRGLFHWLDIAQCSVEKVFIDNLLISNIIVQN